MEPEEIDAALVPGSRWTLRDFFPPQQIEILTREGGSGTLRVVGEPETNEPYPFAVEMFASGGWDLDP